MSSGISQVATQVAVAALTELAKSAAGLVSEVKSTEMKLVTTVGTVAKDRSERHTVTHKSNNLGDDQSTIDTDTDTFVKAQFANAYGYYFDVDTSHPPNAVAGAPIKGLDDILVWDPAKYTGTANLDSYLQKIFLNFIPDSVSISLASNLSDLFAARFSEQSLAFQALNKSFTYPYSGKNITVDFFMVTACAESSDGSDLKGICRYCCVAYESVGWAGFAK